MFCVPNPPLTSLTSRSANEPSGRQYCDITVHWPMAVFLGRALLGPPPSIGALLQSPLTLRTAAGA